MYSAVRVHHVGDELLIVRPRELQVTELYQDKQSLEVRIVVAGGTAALLSAATALPFLGLQYFAGKVQGIEAAAKTVRSSQGEKIVSNDGWWCLRKALNATSTDKTGKTEELVTYQYYDMETGILLREDGSNQSFLRGIQLGLFYPELFDLPKGYKMQDMTKSMMGAMEALLKVQNSEGTPEEKQKQLQEMLKSLQK